MTERRQERKNETSIMATLGDMKVTLALLVQGQTDTNDHLTTLNGKVVAHENRLNDQALINQKVLQDLTDLNKRNGAEDTSKQGFNAQVRWGLFVGAMIVLYKVLVFVGIISNFLNR